MIPVVLGVLGITAILLVTLVGFPAIVAAQAHWRGYNFFPWLFMGMLGNSIFLLVLLAVMPDYSRKAMRRRFAEELEEKLRHKTASERIGPEDEKGTPGVPVSERSLGDLPTVAPRERSLGDEETRL